MAPTEPKLRRVQFLNSIVAHSASLFPIAQGDSKVKMGEWLSSVPLRT